MPGEYYRDVPRFIETCRSAGKARVSAVINADRKDRWGAEVALIQWVSSPGYGETETILDHLELGPYDTESEAIKASTDVITSARQANGALVVGHEGVAGQPPYL